MASPVYVYHASSQDDSDATWNSSTIAYLTLALGLAAVDAGGIIYIASDHAEQLTGDTTYVSTNGVAANPVTIISTKRLDDSYETMVTGGGAIDGKTGGAWDISLTGWDIWVGLEFIAGDNLNIGAADVDVRLIDCTLLVDDNCGISTAGDDCCTYWENVYYEQITAGAINITGSFYWSGGSFKLTGGTVTDLFILSTTRGGNIDIQDVDIQDVDGDNYLISDVNTAHDILFKRCKIPAAVNYMNTGPTGGAYRVRFHSVDDGNYIYKFLEYYFEGNIQEDIAVYRSATYDGTNEYSAKMVSNANAKEYTRPLRFKLADLWCAANPTLTVELNTDNVVLQNDEFWIEIEYPDGTTGALGKIDRTSKAATILTTPANLTTSAEAWTEGFGTEKPQKIEETISGGQAGIHTIWACLAKPLTTIYVCPKIAVA